MVSGKVSVDVAETVDVFFSPSVLLAVGSSTAAVELEVVELSCSLSTDAVVELLDLDSSLEAYTHTGERLGLISVKFKTRKFK